MNRKQLVEQIRSKGSFLCVGLDTDLEKIPSHLLELEDPIFEFNRQIIDAVHPYCVAIKPNLAFYEQYGVKGWLSFERTVKYIREKHPELFIIADAKRGDIGNTSLSYAKAFFEQMGCHSITVAPYMGHDSVKPFLTYKDHWTIVLGLTSNPGAHDFQQLALQSGEALFEKVLAEVASWGSPDQLMFVVGATRSEKLADIRKIIPEHFLLVPGVGAQGGSLEEVARFGMNSDVGLLVNASRSVIYASSGADFVAAARSEAKSLRDAMAALLK